ncbi:transposase [Streptomyces griseoluteus]|uniref:transposase n=1 Tax=Streptomyces griseoluteus TaxID=29306 RepID=UPI00367D2518
MPLTDAQWSRIEPQLPDRTPRRGGRWRDHREVIDAIAWKFQTGSQWIHLSALVAADQMLVVDLGGAVGAADRVVRAAAAPAVHLQRVDAHPLGGLEAALAVGQRGDLRLHLDLGCHHPQVRQVALLLLPGRSLRRRGGLHGRGSGLPLRLDPHLRHGGHRFAPEPREEGVLLAGYRCRHRFLRKPRWGMT